MTIDYQAPVSPTALTSFVRQVPIPATNTITAQLGPMRQVDDIHVDMSELVQVNQAVSYRNFDGAFASIKRGGYNQARVPLLPLGGHLTEGEFERLQRRFVMLGGTATERQIEAIYNDGENLARSTLNRLELAAGEALAKGALEISENGVESGVIDFGIADDNKPTVAKSWLTDPSADVLTEMLAWRDARASRGDVAAGQVVTTQKVLSALLRNTTLINMAVGAQVQRSILTVPELNALLSSFNLPTIGNVYDHQIEDNTGTVKRVIPEDTFIWAPANMSEAMSIYVGVTNSALTLATSGMNSFSMADAPGMVGIIDTDSAPPYRQAVYVDMVALPIITNPRALFIANVGGA